MNYITREQWEEIARKSAEPDTRTPEEIAKMEEVGRKLKSLSPQERRAIRRKLDEENGYM